MRFLVIGAGKQGSACALDLLKLPSVSSVVLVDRTTDHPAEYLKPFLGKGRLQLLKLDITDTADVKAAMQGANAVLSAAPYYYNGALAAQAVEAGAHFADLGGNTEIALAMQRDLDAAAQAKGVSVIPDCGLAPGLVNILAGEGIARLDRVESVRIYVGGLPQHPEPPLNYFVVYSLEGVLDYYTTPSWVLRGGKRTQVEALSELEDVDFGPGLGVLEAFHTGGGISTMPFHYEGKIPVMEYKTLRYPGHVAIMKAIRELGLLSLEKMDVGGTKVTPRELFIRIVTPTLTKPRGLDLVALRVEVRGTKGGKAAGWRWNLVDRYDEVHHVTSMMRTTGYSLSVTGLMQCDGRITKTGVFAPDEGVPCAPMLDELAKRGIVVEETAL
jgi:lysine 6-dehydrogenase